MKMNHKSNYANVYFRKTLVPILHRCDSCVGLKIARAISRDSSITLVGMVGMKEGESLSLGATRSQELRNSMRKMMRKTELRARASVVVSNTLWADFQRIVHEENPELLILDWPKHFEALNITPFEVFRDLSCDIALVRGPIADDLSNVLIPIRGGPHSELTLRISLAIQRYRNASCTSLHILPESDQERLDAPYRGIARVLANIPDLEKLSLICDDPEAAILGMSQKFDLIVMGATARPTYEFEGLGKVAESLLKNSPAGVVVVKTHRLMEVEPITEYAGKKAISVLVDRWFAENTYHADEFMDLKELVKLKQDQNLTISVALPALNEAKTVGLIIQTIKGQLMERIPLVDEIVLMDSNSTDETREIALDLGIPVFIHQQILPDYGPRRGKGEALWKSLQVTKGDILLWIDTDITNIHPRFIYGLVGPLLVDPKIAFVKGFYRRPIKVGERILAGGGGRVTELTARPLLNLFFPELSGVIQPLAGEYGGRRSLLEKLPFFSGYGVEIGLLIDALKNCGLDGIAQVDLQERIHHNQSLEALSKMSFAIIQAVTRKLETYFDYPALEDVNLTMKLIHYETGRLYLDVEEIAEMERPPIANLKEYRSLRKL